VKQTLFMVAVTLVGTVGVFTHGPICGVAVYYFFAVLRPQFIWEWSLPTGIQWSQYVAIATILAVPFQQPAPDGGVHGGPAGQPTRCWSPAHTTVLLFAGWVVLSYANAFNRDYGYLVFVDYLKIFTMFVVSSFVIRTVDHLWIIMLLTALSLGYIAYEVNYLYLVNHYLGIYRNGYGGLDNNGAGLMLAMGVPLCLFAWEGTRSRLRWGFVALIPTIVHAVFMTYSRGAMLSLLISWPLMVARSRQRLRIGLATVVFGVVGIPLLAGPEIQERFFSIKDNEVDESANSRRQSWAAAWKIAKDYPIFGVGVRNANLFSYQYGADMEGRTIHSQYLQIAADCGFVGLGLYLAIYLSVIASFWRTRRAARSDRSPEADRARAIASGVESALLLFCFGAIFLSLEVFELPYLLMLIGAQLSVVYRQPSSGPFLDPSLGERTRWV
jgi:probable O-glycosylation ligase (exosortase A-associated)